MLHKALKGITILAATAGLCLGASSTALCAYGTYGTYDTTDEPSSIVISQETLRTAVTQTSTMISARISKIISPRSLQNKVAEGGNNISKGLAAGDGANKFGIWANASLTDSENSATFSISDSTLKLAMLGADVRITDNFLFGAAIVLEDGDTTTTFNNGSMDTSAYTLAPYIAYLFNDNFSADLTLAYTWGDIEQNRLGGTIISSLDTNRWFAAANLHAYHSINAWNFTGSLGYTQANEDQDSFIESGVGGNTVAANSLSLAMVNAAVEVSYANDVIEPYFNLTYTYDTEYDTIPGLSYDEDAFTPSLGCRFLIMDNLTGDFSASAVVDRSDQTESSYMVNLRYEF